MRQKKSPIWRDGARGATLSVAYAAPPVYTCLPVCQICRSAGELAGRAQGLAERSAARVVACREAGDLEGGEHWRRRQLRHEAIRWALERVP